LFHAHHFTKIVLSLFQLLLLFLFAEKKKHYLPITFARQTFGQKVMKKVFFISMWCWEAKNFQRLVIVIFDKENFS